MGHPIASAYTYPARFRGALTFGSAPARSAAARAGVVLRLRRGGVGARLAFKAAIRSTTCASLGADEIVGF